MQGNIQGTILSNRYLMEEQVGTGGMGSVFRATDLRTGGQVAVKIPHQFLAHNAEYLERLRREAQIAASLYSPRIVRVIDLDTTESGLPFLVMEYVPGDTLGDELHRRGRLPLEDALRLGLETARALDAAHQKGIVHRDLKPHNIKLVDGEVKVLDFGIAKAEGFAGLTSASIFMGTPEYAAPERAEGLGDIRSDIYALGVILYEALAGTLPFTGLSPISVLRKHETEPPPPLPEDVPEDVSAIVMRCLEKRQEDRYQTPREMVLDLSAVLAGKGIATHATGASRTTDAAGTTGQPVVTAASTVVERRSNSVGPTPTVAGHAQTAPAPASGAIPADSAPVKKGGLPGWAIPAGVGAVLVIAAAVAAVALSGGGGDEQVSGQGTAVASSIATVTVTPAVATAQATAPVAATTTASGPTPLDTPPVVATIPADAGSTADERAVIEAINTANRAQILAYRRADPAGLDTVLSGQALRDTVSSVSGSLRRQGRYAIADLKSIQMVSLTMSGPDRAVVKTRETMDYDEYLLSDHTRVTGAGYTGVQVWTYNLVKQSNRWLMDQIDQPVQEQYEQR